MDDLKEARILLAGSIAHLRKLLSDLQVEDEKLGALLDSGNTVAYSAMVNAMILQSVLEDIKSLEQQ